MIHKFYVIEAISLVAPIFYCYLKEEKQNIDIRLNTQIAQHLLKREEQISIQEIMIQCAQAIKKHKLTLECMYETTILQHQSPILEPYKYLTKRGGKKIRLSMALIVNAMFNKQTPQIIIKIGGLVQLLHSASLIIDDIQDGSILRRDQKCCHLVYGLDRSINAANLMYFLPFKNLLKSVKTESHKFQIIQIFAEQLITSHLGQAQDVLVHKLKRKQDLPQLQQYFRMTSAKTSSLLRMMVKMIGVVLNVDTKTIDNLSHLMNYVGISFQITDDILNLTRGMGKGIVAEDLHQKKFTIVIHFLRDHEEFMSLFINPEPNKEKSVQRMLSIIQQMRVIQKCKQIAQQFKQKALKQVLQFQCPYSKHKFVKLIDFIVSRNK